MRVLLSLFPLALLVGCPEQDVKDDTQAPADTGPDLAREIEVVADGQAATVDLYDLDTATFEGNEVVAVTAVLDASGLGVTWAERTYDFEAGDGFTPSSRDCEPVDYTALGKAYFYRETGNLVWDDEEMPGCYFVDDTVRILVQDAG